MLLILSAILISFAPGDLCGASSICLCRRVVLGSDMSSVTSATSAATRSPNCSASSAASDTNRRPERIASQLAHHIAPKAVDHALSRQCHELHVAGLPGLEADGGAGGDV